MKLSLEPERSSRAGRDADDDLDGLDDLDADDVDADDDELQPSANEEAKLPHAVLSRRLWKKNEFETWKKEVENLASLTFDIECSLRRSHSTAATLNNEIDPIASRADEAERSLRQCKNHLLGIDDRLRSLSG